ncbi:MAG: hypothetical protein ACYS47_06285, partial [Planctomycetota bacterium]
MMPLSEKRLFIALIVVSLGVTGLFGILCFRERGRIGETRERIRKSEVKIEAFKRKGRRIPWLESALARSALLHADNRIALPPRRFDEALLKGIQGLANESGVRINMISPDSPPRRNSSAEPDAPWRTFRFRIEVEGGFSPLLRFMNSLEHYPRLLAIRGGMFSPLQTRRGKGEDEDDPRLKLDLRFDSFASREVSVDDSTRLRPGATREGRVFRRG